MVRPTKLDPQTRSQIRAYFAAMPLETRKRLRDMRAAVLSVVPGGVDGYSYRMPCIRLNGKIVAWYAGFSSHTSLFPMTEKIRRANAAALKGYETSKGTVRFPLDKPLSTTLVKRLVKARLLEMR